MDVTAKPALVNKSQTQPSSWKKWILLLAYQLVIQVLLLGFNIATSWYIERHKIPINTRLAESSSMQSMSFYLMLSQHSIAVVWMGAVILCKTYGGDSTFQYLFVVGNILGCLSNILGFAVLAFLLFTISPGLALYFRLLFVLCSIVTFFHCLYICFLVKEMCKKQS
ncbi:hypothetical protein ARALYDRAFT_918069 [Arabidopsis lyrata subsp. lyrata]|uniref:Uncharacterized protein n=1 Tax=Arabidopsis lyrata subsp. lyrata TaxID=81972 RepID=D7MQ72_ARALL|nr:hypothetical protein ARALYDRAFT_918069 [Arabidopsis lyrata subsp. lyrata]